MLRWLRAVRTALHMTANPPVKPLIAIVGATGTGKSQLAVSLARRYNGEIINGDAMQLYAGLPIITNKITPAEQQGVPHHLLGCIGLHEQTWVVGTFVRNALRVIDEIRSRGRLPILVGGTHYYTQSLLFRDRLAHDPSALEVAPDFVEDLATRWPILREPTEVLFEELKKVDPAMADRWHPNDRRKIQRSLEIYLQTGERASDIYERQRQGQPDASVAGSDDGLALRFPTLLFWVHAERETLQERLNQRVDKMLDAGLLDEVRDLASFARSQTATGHSLDGTKGIWVSIGYKEFKDYTDALRTEQADGESLEKLKAEALEKTKVATRQYARRQVQWIRVKLAKAFNDANAQDSFFVLDASDATVFESRVESPALDVASAFLEGSPLPDPCSLSSAAATVFETTKEASLASKPDKWTKQHCEACDVTCSGADQWRMHIKSRSHRRIVSKSNNPDTSRGKRLDVACESGNARDGD